MVWWKGLLGKHCSGEIWKVVPLRLMWCVWREELQKLLRDAFSLMKIKILLLSDGTTNCFSFLIC